MADEESQCTLQTFYICTAYCHSAVKSGQAGNSTKGVVGSGLTVLGLGQGPSLPRALTDSHLPFLGFESDLPQWEAAVGLF